jgi:uncharacterized protein YciI
MAQTPTRMAADLAAGQGLDIIPYARVRARVRPEQGARAPRGRLAHPEPEGPSEAMTDVPDGIEIENVFLVEVAYTPDAPARRPALRPRHLTRIARLMREGRVVEAGGCADFSKAVLIVRATSEEDAVALIEEDVYVTGGVWQSPRAVGYGRVVPAAEG